jgi:hypothetical protein
MKRCNGVYWLAPVAAVALVVIPVKAQSPFDLPLNPWSPFNDRFFDRHHRFFHNFRFFRFGYAPDWYRELYGGHPYYYAIPDDDFDHGLDPEYDERYPVDLALMVQTELARRGYYDGPISGVIGPHSQMAIREFQAAEGLPVTGRIDQNLVRALRSGEFDTPPKDSSVTPLPSPSPAAPEQESPPVAQWVKGKEGQQVLSPFTGGVVDVSGFPPGSEARCPYSSKIFLVPRKP